MDLIEEDLKPIRHDPRTTDEEKRMINDALDKLSNRYRMMALWFGGKETLEQRKYRLAHGMFLDDSDPEFLKELLLGKPSE